MQKAKKKWYQKWWVWLIIILVIGGIGSMNQEEDKTSDINNTTNSQPESVPATTDASEKTDKKEADAKPVEEVIAITASKLWSEYDENEVSADSKYKGKQLEVSGTVSDIGKDILDSIYITLKTDDIIGSVQVYFSDKDSKSVGELKKGQDITVVGKGDGKSLVNVIIKKAQIK